MSETSIKKIAQLNSEPELFQPQDKARSIKDSANLLNSPGELILEKWGGRNPNFYGYDLSYLDDLSTKFKIFRGCPEIREFSNVIYLPEYECLYSSEGSRIDYSCIYRRTNRSDLVTKAPEQITPPKNLKKVFQKLIYAGKISQQYGHFLTEANARLWYLIQENQYAALCHDLRGIKHKNNNFIDVFFEAVNLHKNIFISFEEPILIESVIIPYPSFSNQAEAFNIHKLIPENVAANLVPKEIKQTAQPLYLSRRYLNPKDRLIINEAELEEKLERCGFSIVYPEQLSLEQQIYLVNKHEVVVGTTGSALHSLLFNISLKRNLICFGYQEKINTNYLIIDALKSINSTYIGVLQKDPNCFKLKSRQNRIIDLNTTIKVLKEIGLISGSVTY